MNNPPALYQPASRPAVLFVGLAGLLSLYLAVAAVTVPGNDPSICAGSPVCEGVFARTQAAALLVWSLVLVASLVGAWMFRRAAGVAYPLVAVIPLLGIELALRLGWGGSNLAALEEPFRLGSLLLVQALVILAGAGVLIGETSRLVQTHWGAARSLTVASLWSLGAVFAVLVSGAAVPVSGASRACAAWPLCGGSLQTLGLLDGVQLAHRLFVGLAAVAIIALVVHAWRRHRSNTVVLSLATAAGVLFVGQGLVGAMQVLQGEGLYLRMLHSAAGALVWGALVGVAVSARAQAPVGVAPRRSWRDYLALTKPLIVGLLLFTTYSGMVVAYGGQPPLELVAWTLLGGALAAGGSGAINQYIDRRLDRMMVRTARRPIAAGRLTPAEGLAFGVALCLAAFFLLAVFVNLAAALLAVGGMLYYVVLYSLLLKKTTVQNIVIGGGAGAIPPLVGWAAVTGSLTLPSLLLFAIIFLWTPPHFWALALVRSKDYERAGVPMLPVVRGQRETRRQVWIYTLALVALTLAVPLAGIGGWVYFLSAVGLGVVLVGAAWQVYHRVGNKVAWRMYRYSSMYLAFLFLGLIIDTLV